MVKKVNIVTLIFKPVKLVSFVKLANISRLVYPVTSCEHGENIDSTEKGVKKAV